MANFYMLIGIQGSGKSTYVSDSGINAVHLSSDALRKEFYGDETVQDNPAFIFEEMKRRTVAHLLAGNDVMYDATNVNAKKRRVLLSYLKAQVKDLETNALYLYTDFEECVRRNNSRDRVVPYEVLKRTYKALQVPTYSEGWDNIHYIADSIERGSLKVEINSYEDYLSFLKDAGVAECIEFEQHNPYHSLTVSRHMYDAYKFTVDNNMPLTVQIAALCHDVGKPFCQVFEGEYARYFGHDSVSAQLALHILMRTSFHKEIVLETVELIQNHMKAHQIVNASAKAQKKMERELGTDKFNNLLMLHQADMSTK